MAAKKQKKKRAQKPAKPVVEIKNLTVRYDRVVLRKVSWKIEKGQQWVLLGSNGSGKTTLLMAMAGYVTPTRGEVIAGREDIAWSDLRKHIGVVSASVAQRIDPEETAFEVILSGREAMINHWGKIPRDLRKATKKVLRKVEAEHLRKRPWGVLSQGERQRVLVGRALMCKARLLILDEPCAGLDPVAREDFLSFINRLASRKRGAPTLVFVTHHVEEIIPAITHAALLAEGEFVAKGPADEVLKTSKLRDTFGAEVKLRRSHDRYRLRVDS
ncbi:MAG: ATP-binding cassette domain-containing protein [Verrucomicrobiales bacterium]|nr:ATP-binding cassette domain-containing protein [Verrucomicrobiales bacterium]